MKAVRAGPVRKSLKSVLAVPIAPVSENDGK